MTENLSAHERIEVDWASCTACWGPIEGVPIGGHICSRPACHHGRHVCQCGSWTVNRDEVEIGSLDFSALEDS